MITTRKNFSAGYIIPARHQQLTCIIISIY